MHWLLLSGVIVALLLAVYLIRQEVTMRKNGIRTTGVIVDVKRERGDEGGYLYRPIVEFTTLDGQQIIWKCTSSSSVWRNALGKPMRVIYDPQNPQRVIRNHWTNYLAITVVCVIGAVCLVFFFK